MSKVNLTDKFVRSKRLITKPGQSRTDYSDAQVPGMALRVTEKGHKTFVLVARYPANPRNPTRRALGELGELSLDDAREKARAWLKLISKGIDPREEEGRQRLAEARKRQVLVRTVLEDFIREKLPGERKGADVARGLRRDLLPKLGDRPITEVQRIEIRALIKEKKKTAPAQARNLLGDLKRFFGWAVDQESYGLTASPCIDIKAREIIGERRVGDRDLTDDEMFALWRGAGRLPYPHRQIYQLLMLNALRLNEVADASGPEFDFRNRLWTLPKERMKGKNEKARPHVVPLTEASLEVLASLPTFRDGPYLFSLTFGKSPVWVTSKVKARLDARMLRTLRAMARKRGEDPDSVTLPPWTNHDIRRTVRTNLSPLRNARGIPIADEVKEAILAHVRPGIKGVYDRYQYLDEKQEALELWAERLQGITRPRQADVIVLADRRQVPA